MRAFQWFLAVSLLLSVAFGRITADSGGVQAVLEAHGVVTTQCSVLVDETEETLVDEVATVVAVVLLVLVVVLALIILNNSVKGGS